MPQESSYLPNQVTAVESREPVNWNPEPYEPATEYGGNFMVQAAYARKNPAQWAKVSEKLSSGDGFYRLMADDDGYKLAVFTVWLCLEYGILSIDGPYALPHLDLDAKFDSIGLKPLPFARLANTRFTMNAERVWELWGSPLPQYYDQFGDEEVEILLVDFLLAAWDDLDFPVEARTKSDFTTVSLDIRELLEREQQKWPGTYEWSISFFWRSPNSYTGQVRPGSRYQRTGRVPAL